MDDEQSARAIRRQVLLALARNRAPGYHYPGYLLGCSWPRIGEDELETAMPDGPEGRNVDGSVNLAAFCVLLDITLATSARLKRERGVRQAAVHLHAQFTGAPLRGELTARARLTGYASNSAATESIPSGTFHAGGVPVCQASGTFVALPPPPGVTMAPLPWQREGAEPETPLKPKELSPEERMVMRACNAALRRADARHGFIEHFWGALPV